MPRYNREQAAAEIADGRRWQDFGECRGDMNLFFGPENEKIDPKRQREALAKAVCARCVVKADCLQYALQADEKFGVWGGLGEQERQLLLRRSRGEVA